MLQGAAQSAGLHPHDRIHLGIELFVPAVNRHGDRKSFDLRGLIFQRLVYNETQEFPLFV